MQHDAQADDDRRWVPLVEAARQLGISVDTARRRIRRGDWPTSATRQHSTPQGFTWEVDLGALRTSATEVRSTDPGTPPTRLHPAAEAGHLAAILRDTQGALMQQTQAAAMWQARAEHLGQQLEQARGELLALKAPDPVPVVEPLATPSPPPTQEPPRPWWRVW